MRHRMPRRLFSFLIKDMKSMSEHLNYVQKLSIISRLKNLELWFNIVQISDRDQRWIIPIRSCLINIPAYLFGPRDETAREWRRAPQGLRVARASLEKGTTLARLLACSPLLHNSSYLRPTCCGFSARIQPAVVDTRAICSSKICTRPDSSDASRSIARIFIFWRANRVTKVFAKHAQWHIT